MLVLFSRVDGRMMRAAALHSSGSMASEREEEEMRRSVPIGCWLLLLLLATKASAFSGSVTQDTTWTTDMQITGDVAVRNGATLTILPHLTILFEGPWQLSLPDGAASTLLADSCTFTSGQGTPGSWRGISLGWGASIQLVGCELSCATNGIANLGDFNQVRIAGCYIHHNQTGIYHCGGMVKADAVGRQRDLTVRFEGNRLEWNEIGIREEWGHGGAIDGNLIRNNSAAGVSLGDYCESPVTRNQILANNVGILIEWSGLGRVACTVGGSLEQANRICDNTSYAVSIGQASSGLPASLNAQYNDWGPVTTGEMMNEGFPSDIEAIYDCWDNVFVGYVDYQNWIVDPAGVGLADPVETAAAVAPVPNPFRGETRLVFRLPESGIAGSGASPGGPRAQADGPVTATIHDASGRLVRSFALQAGPGRAVEVRWDGRDGQGHRLPSGVYLCRLHAGRYVACAHVVRAGS
jgi:hypothetical protein